MTMMFRTHKTYYEDAGFLKNKLFFDDVFKGTHTVSKKIEIRPGTKEL